MKNNIQLTEKEKDYITDMIAQNSFDGWYTGDKVEFEKMRQDLWVKLGMERTDCPTSEETLE